MEKSKLAPYGSWASPIDAESIALGSVRLGQIMLDGANIYWSELRPFEGGRTTIMRRDGGGADTEVLHSKFSARTRVHEYGGGAFCVDGGCVWFCNDTDQRIYMTDGVSDPLPITVEGPYRYSDLTVDRKRSRLLCVLEDHSGGGEPKNTLVAVQFDGLVETLDDNADFYAAPRVSPNGDDFAWIEWFHPNMPWDEAALYYSHLDEEGRVVNPVRVTGAGEAAFQPEFGPDGSLYYVSDRSGWWNLYRLSKGGIDCVYAVEAEFGLPHWVFGMRTYDFSIGGRIVVTFLIDGISKLGEIDLANGTLRTIPVPHIDIVGLRARAGRAFYIGAGTRAPSGLIEVDLGNGSTFGIRSSQDVIPDPGSVSVAQPVVFETADDEIAHGFYYPPMNDFFKAPADDLPPLIVKSHGGPTGQTGCAYDPKIQFWTSRGFAVLDVNYRGSTGFGRRYRQLLHGKWGVADIEDCAAGARILVEQGLADGERMAITGGSAGGYTTLCALTFLDVFKAGASHYGIGDLEALARDTHKFESRYLDRLVGRWPEDRDSYVARSPLQHADRLSCPVIFFQGLEDKVVPPNQAEALVATLREKGIGVAYVTFEDEGHGFRQAINIRQALEAELSFYGQVFGFEPAGDIEPVKIENF
ncbi:MAG: Dipeptidyl aminopeptidase BIII [Alphaproteobacteria bacterium MarineAlpha4_Bin2]|nr:MAG: Dipeptidyl aminopeptidase BIII [Alphaproteobacteria bacterium MarineAlpha4_Bin2]